MTAQTSKMKEKSTKMFGPLTFDYNHVIKTSETKCLLCRESFDLSVSVTLFLKHIFEAHNMVIGDVQQIEELPKYIDYWRDRFTSSKVEEIIPSLNVDCTGHKYFLLSDLLKEDKELRHKLTLEHVLKVQETERKDAGYAKPCLLCRLEFEGTRHDFIRHLSDAHNIQLGNPENLVYIDEMVNKIDSKMKDHKCIYCEKTFPNRNVLKEHMRKKIHKRINPKSTEYDRYYIVNYLEPDKTWKDLEKEDDRYAIDKSHDANDDNEYLDWYYEEEFVNCLFCQHKEKSLIMVRSHMVEEHSFNFVEQTKGLDFYQQIKLVNYIRKQIHSNRCLYCDLDCSNFTKLDAHLKEKEHYKVPDVKIFDQPEYYFPTYENDAFLYLIEDLDHSIEN